MICDSISTERSIFRTVTSGEAVVSTYQVIHEDSNPVRCCLAYNEWYQNPLACISQEDEEITYTFRMQMCSKHTCTRTNLYLPSSGQRD